MPFLLSVLSSFLRVTPGLDYYFKKPDSTDAPGPRVAFAHRRPLLTPTSSSDSLSSSTDSLSSTDTLESKDAQLIPAPERSLTPGVYYNSRFDPENFRHGPLSYDPATRLRQMLARPGIVVRVHIFTLPNVNNNPYTRSPPASVMALVPDVH